MNSRSILAEAHSSEPNVLDGSESEIDQATFGWRQGQTAYDAPSNRLGSICDFELDQESGRTFAVVQWNDSAVERVVAESLNCPLQFSNSGSDAPIPTDNPRKDSVNLSPLCNPPLVEITITQTDRRLALSLICTDGCTQSRAAGLNDTTVKKYAEAMNACQQ